MAFLIVPKRPLALGGLFERIPSLTSAHLGQEHELMNNTMGRINHKIVAAVSLCLVVSLAGCNVGDAVRDGFFGGITTLVSTVVTTTVLGQ